MKNIDKLIALELYIETNKPNLVDSWNGFLFDNNVKNDLVEIEDSVINNAKTFIKDNKIDDKEILSMFEVENVLNESDKLNESKQTVTDTAKDIYGTLENARKEYKEDYRSFYAEMSAVLEEEDVKLIDEIFNLSEEASDEPFKIGDKIEADGRKGVVTLYQPTSKSCILDFGDGIEEVFNETDVVKLNESFEIKPSFYENLKKYNENANSENNISLKNITSVLIGQFNDATLAYVLNNDSFNDSFVDFIGNRFDDLETNFLFNDEPCKEAFSNVFGSQSNYKNAILGLTQLMIPRLKEGTLQHVNFGEEIVRSLLPVDIKPSELLESKGFGKGVMSCNESVIVSLLESNRYLGKENQNGRIAIINTVTGDTEAIVSNDYKHCAGDIFGRFKLNESKSYVSLKNRIVALNESFDETLSDNFDTGVNPIDKEKITPDFLEWLVGNSHSSQDLNDYLISNAEKLSNGDVTDSDVLIIKTFMSSNGDDLDSLLNLYDLRDKVQDIGGVRYVVEDKIGDTRTTEITPLGGINSDIADVISEEILPPVFGTVEKTEDGCYVADNCEKSMVTTEQLVQEFGILENDAEDVINILNDVYPTEVQEFVLNEEKKKKNWGVGFNSIPNADGTGGGDMSESDEKSPEFLEGYKAFGIGDLPNLNPYQDGDDLKKSKWTAGYNKAKHEEENLNEDANEDAKMFVSDILNLSFIKDRKDVNVIYDTEKSNQIATVTIPYDKLGDENPEKLIDYAKNYKGFKEDGFKADADKKEITFHFLYESKNLNEDSKLVEFSDAELKEIENELEKGSTIKAFSMISNKLAGKNITSLNVSDEDQKILDDLYDQATANKGKSMFSTVSKVYDIVKKNVSLNESKRTDLYNKLAGSAKSLLELRYAFSKIARSSSGTSTTDEESRLADSLLDKFGKITTDKLRKFIGDVASKSGIDIKILPDFYRTSVEFSAKSKEDLDKFKTILRKEIKNSEFNSICNVWNEFKRNGSEFVSDCSFNEITNNKLTLLGSDFAKNLNESVNSKKAILKRLFEARGLKGYERLIKLHESIDAPLQTYADMVVYNADGKVLLLQRNPDCGFEPNKWGFAGGKVQVGEVTKAGAIRECLEESGINVDNETVEKIGEFSNPDGSISHYYKGNALNDVELGDESQNFIWVDPSDVINYDLILGNKDRFNLVVNGVQPTTLNENRILKNDFNFSQLSAGDTIKLKEEFGGGLPMEVVSVGSDSAFVKKNSTNGTIEIKSLSNFEPVSVKNLNESNDYATDWDSMSVEDREESLDWSELDTKYKDLNWEELPENIKSSLQKSLGLDESKKPMNEASFSNILGSLAKGDLVEIAGLISSPKKYAKASLGRIILDKLNKMGIVGDKANAIIDKLLKFYPTVSTGFNFLSSLIESKSLNEANNYSDEIAKIEEQAKLIRQQEKSEKRDAELADLKKRVDELRIKGDEEEIQKLIIKIDAINREIQLEKNQEKLEALKKESADLEARKKKLQDGIDAFKKSLTDALNTADDLMTDPDINKIFKK